MAFFLGMNMKLLQRDGLSDSDHSIAFQLVGG